MDEIKLVRQVTCFTVLKTALENQHADQMTKSE